MQIIRGGEIANHIEELGQFRIAIFNEFPYLYAGDMGAERKYLGRYLRSEESILVTVTDQHGLLGACTGLPLKNEEGEFKAPFAGSDIDEIFYIGEVMVRAGSRGKGIGSNLLSTTIRSVDQTRYKKLFLCAVDRGANHPLRPDNYRSPDSLWMKFGFSKKRDTKVYFACKDIGSAVETEKPMNVWVRGEGFDSTCAQQSL